MSEERLPLLDGLNEAIVEIEVCNFITRDSELQRAACEQVAALLRRLADLKKEAVEDADENLANTLLGYECAVGFIGASISMWLLLKEGKPDDAWSRLVEAQMLVADAVRAHPGFKNIEIHGRRLRAVEELVFPPQNFMSLGMIVRKRLCSVCGEEYGECDHLVGRPYMGRFCRTIVTEIEQMDHVALVFEPANKNARVVEFTVPGGRRNKMTWKVTPGEIVAHEVEDDRKGLTVTAVLASANFVDY
jgi:hypothetical protein